jgi:hypothetical protein
LSLNGLMIAVTSFMRFPGAIATRSEDQVYADSVRFGSLAAVKTGYPL